MPKSLNSNPICIIGGAGFVGSNLALKLRDKDVVIIDKLTHGLSEALDLNNNKVTFLDLDFNVANAEKLTKLFKEKNFFQIYHLAANSDIRPSDSLVNRDLRDTLGSTLALIEISKEIQLNNVIFASTSAIFGETSKKIDLDYHENFALKPISDYGVCKLASEYILKEAVFENRIKKLGIVRFPNVVGVNSTHGILFDFFMHRKHGEKVLKVLGDGTQAKPYIEVTDLVNLILEFSEEILRGESEINFVNLSPIDVLSVRDIANMFVEITNWNVPIEYGSENFGWKGDVNTYQYEPSRYSTKLPNSREAVKKAIEDLNKDHRFKV
jgi:UDP-glucose 4-epimerase